MKSSAEDPSTAPWGTSDSPLDCPDVAIVFEGGGMRNSYTVGAVQALIDHQVNPGWVGGISAGTTHVVNFLIKNRTRAKASFVDFVEDPRFGGWKTFAKGKGYFNTEFIYTESVMPGEIAEMDFDAFMKSSPEFAIGALRADTGDMTWWRRDDVQTLEQLSAYTRASSTIPFFMPVAHVDGCDYYDGAMGPTGGFAYDAAIEDGYSKFLFILTRPKSFRREPMSQARLIRSYFRRQPAVAEAILQRAEHYNHSKEKIAQWEKEGRAMVFYPDQMPVHNKERNVEKLQKSYEMGVDQVAREWPRWEEFLRG